MKKRILLPTSFFFIALFSIFLFGFMIGSFFLAQIINMNHKGNSNITNSVKKPGVESKKENSNITQKNQEVKSVVVAELKYIRYGNYFHREHCNELDNKKFYKQKHSYNRKENIEDGLIPCPHCNP